MDDDLFFLAKLVVWNGLASAVFTLYLIIWDAIAQ